MTPLEQKIRKHCPDLKTGFHEKMADGFTKFVEVYHDIHLEHVLRAIENMGNTTITNKGGYLIFRRTFGTWSPKQKVVFATYDLSLPFSQQSPEVHKFINDLID